MKSATARYRHLRSLYVDSVQPGNGAVRQRGRATDPVWANRRRLLRDAERLSGRAMRRMWNGLIDNDPSGQMTA
jgi:hypothetical protein